MSVALGESLQVSPVSGVFRARLAPPGSKSLTNRALVLASMARGETVLSNVLFADDTRVMLEGLKVLGYEVEVDESARVVKVRGGDPSVVPAKEARLFCGNSGTTLRFLCASLARGKGRYVLDGVERMRERPVGEMGEMLKNLGVRLSYEGKAGYPPVVVEANGLPGGTITFGAAKSSQYLSAVLMVSPFARHEVRVNLEGRQTSWPYVGMTMRLMDLFGHTAELERDPDSGEPKRIVVPKGEYVGTTYAVEPDASNASYFLAAAALHPGSSVTIENLGRSSLQGDVAMADYLSEMGARVTWEKNSVTVEGTKTLRGVELDLRGTPDLAQTLAVVAAFAEGPTVLKGLFTLRVKETDRVAALVNELGKMGVETSVSEEGDVSLTIYPPRSAREFKPANIETYDDHRMAMSFAVAGTRASGVTILNPGCCSKTYPEFFSDFSTAVGAQVMGSEALVALMALHQQRARR